MNQLHIAYKGYDSHVDEQIALIVGDYVLDAGDKYDAGYGFGVRDLHFFSAASFPVIEIERAIKRLNLGVEIVACQLI